MKMIPERTLSIGIACVLGTLAPANPAVRIAAGEVMERITREGGEEMAERAVRETAERALKRDAGRLLIRDPAGDRMLRSLSHLGPEAALLEARAPGLGEALARSFGDDAARDLARTARPEDLPRLLAYAERADGPATRRMLEQAYRREGPRLFERIPPGLVLATGLSASMLVASHNLSRPFYRVFGSNPQLAREVIRHAINGVILVFALVAILILWRLRLLPWHGARHAAGNRAGRAHPRAAPGARDGQDGEADP